MIHFKNGLVWSGALTATGGTPPDGDVWVPCIITEQNEVQMYIVSAPGAKRRAGALWVPKTYVKTIADAQQWEKYITADEVRL